MNYTNPVARQVLEDAHGGRGSIQEGVKMAIARLDELEKEETAGECAATLINATIELQRLHDSLGKRKGKRNG